MKRYSRQRMCSSIPFEQTELCRLERDQQPVQTIFGRVEDLDASQPSDDAVQDLRLNVHQRAIFHIQLKDLQVVVSCDDQISIALLQQRRRTQSQSYCKVLAARRQRRVVDCLHIAQGMPRRFGERKVMQDVELSFLA